MNGQATLVVTHGPLQGRTVALALNEPLIIGRLPEVGLCIPNDLAVSRRQCQIVLLPSGDCVITNLSHNGTLLNGAEITEAKLNDGDEIAFGDSTVLRVEITPAPAVPAPSDPLPLAATGQPQVPAPESLRVTAVQGARAFRFPSTDTQPPLPDRSEEVAPPADAPALFCLAGQHARRIFPLSAAAPFVIGRLSELELTLVDDPLVSRRHCQIEFTARGLIVTDLGSSNGTLVNGRRVTVAPLADGDELEVGDSRFEVRLPVAARRPKPVSPTTDTLPATDLTVVDIVPPPPAKTADVTLDMLFHGAIVVCRLGDSPLSLADEKQRQLFPEYAGHGAWPFRSVASPRFNTAKPLGGLYAVIDGAQNLELAFLATLAGHTPASLFVGESAPQLAQVAPYFVPFPADPEYLTEWLAALGGHAGLLFDSPAKPEELFVHLRNIFIAQDEAGQEYFFRYYDPRVLRVYLPTCTVPELKTFFGPIRRFLVETEAADGYTAYSWNAEGLVTDPLGLLEPAISSELRADPEQKRSQFAETVQLRH